jgi:hypothetical protein
MPAITFGGGVAPGDWVELRGTGCGGLQRWVAKPNWLLALVDAA